MMKTNPVTHPLMPVLFIGHGNPMNAVMDNDFTARLKALGKSLPKPEAIMVVSAHWLTNGTYVACMERPEMIYDFYGFPKKLYTLTYPAPGAPKIAKSTAGSVKGKDVRCSMQWGLDHAAWTILRYLYPDASVPVFEMSLDYSFNDWHPKPIQYHYELAQELAGLRRQGVMIIGSGNIVHNLGMIDFENMDAPPFRWAGEFDEKVKENLVSGNDRSLIGYEGMGGAHSLAVPTLDHYLPMIYAIALREKDEPLTFIYEGFQNASISMRSFKIGL